MTPNVADAWLGIENHELFASALQVVAHYQASLAAADDHGWDRFDAFGRG